MGEAAKTICGVGEEGSGVTDVWERGKSGARRGGGYKAG